MHDQYKADENNDANKVKYSVYIKMGNERATATREIGNIDRDMTSSCLASSIGYVPVCCARGCWFKPQLNQHSGSLLNNWKERAAFVNNNICKGNRLSGALR